MDPQTSIPKIAMAEYTLDLGVPIVNFLLRLKLVADEAEARQLIHLLAVFPQRRMLQ